MNRRHFLDHRVPPPIVAALCAAAMTGVARLSPGFWFELPFRVPLAWALLAFGFGCAGAGIAAFRHHQTTVNPRKPGDASRLVETGIYRRTRNPMYVGVTLALLGYGVSLTHALAIAMVALFPIYIQRFQIAPEERALATLFGDAFAGYMARVPRWI